MTDQWRTLFLVNGVGEALAGFAMATNPTSVFPTRSSDGQLATRTLGISLMTTAAYASIRSAFMEPTSDVRKVFAQGMFGYHVLVLPGTVSACFAKNAKPKAYLIALFHLSMAASFGYYLFYRKN